MSKTAVYVPDATGFKLVPKEGEGRPIRLSPHFCFLVSPQLHMQGMKPVFPERKNLARAVRLREPLTVEGVKFLRTTDEEIWRVDERNYKHRVRSTPVELPAGSLIMRSFAGAAKGEPPMWFALSPKQERRHNPLRISIGKSGASDRFSLSTVHNLKDQKLYLGSWRNEKQAAAHRADAAYMARTDLIEPDMLPDFL